MRIGSLCSGYAGLDMAIETVFPGARPAWFCEYDDAPARILAHHYPTVPNHVDLTTVNWTTVEPVEIVSAGFPCQPFSAAGRREGENDERHLWPYVLEAIRALRPSYVLLENVAGLRSVGGVFDEPALRCVCGWFGRWGGVHHRESHEVRDGHGHPGVDRHGNEGPSGSCSNAGHVRRDVDYSEPDKPGAFSDYDVDGHRVGGRGVPAANRVTPSTQGRAGEGGPQDRFDTDLSGADRVAGSLPVYRGQLEQVSGAASSTERVERSREGVVSSDGGEGVCPACGGAVGDGSGGHVFRSGLGTVYRDLASLGLDVRWTSVRASDVGAPHHRERLFILATPSDADGDPVREQSVAISGSCGSAVAGVGGASLSDAGSDRLRRGAERLGRERRGAAPEQAGGTQSSADRLRPVDWGQYGPAVRRWERLTRPAPAPTELGTRGKPRLNAEFAEWMMGLPAGHVTGVDLPRPAQLKAIGNGVCPQQAAAALEQLLALEAVTA